MAVRRLKLTADDFPDIDLIGINTSLQDYRLAYFINKETSLKLERLDDLPVYNEKQKDLRNYCLYSYFDPDRRVSYYLCSNDNEKGKMIEQYSQANYFLLVKGNRNDQDMKTIQSILRKLPSVTFVFVTVINKIRDIDGILYDLELHELSSAAKIKQA